jgi:hypothetical protein
LRDEELILRFFAFALSGVSSYRTPQKHWLNDAAKAGMKYSKKKRGELARIWDDALAVSLTWFDPRECFRREGSRAINRALFDLVMWSARNVDIDDAGRLRNRVRRTYNGLLGNDEFQDLISRAVDHTKRTRRRFELWEESFSVIISHG